MAVIEYHRINKGGASANYGMVQNEKPNTNSTKYLEVSVQTWFLH